MEEAQREQTYNQVAEKVIGTTAWGQFYGIMKGAATMGQGAIPHSICISKDGSQIKVYNKIAGKVVGSFLTPTHEYVTKYLAKKQYGKALASTFGLFGQLTDIKEQREATCFTVTPNEVISRANQVAPKEVIKKAFEREVLGVPEDVFLIGTGTITVLALLFLIKAA